MDSLLARLQWWLQGHPSKRSNGSRRRPWLLVSLGNAISEYRFWRWHASGTTQVDWAGALAETRAPRVSERATKNGPESGGGCGGVQDG